MHPNSIEYAIAIHTVLSEDPPGKYEILVALGRLPSLETFLIHAAVTSNGGGMWDASGPIERTVIDEVCSVWLDSTEGSTVETRSYKSTELLRIEMWHLTRTAPDQENIGKFYAAIKAQMTAEILGDG